MVRPIFLCAFLDRNGMSGKVIGDALAQKTVPIPRLEKAKDVVEVNSPEAVLEWLAREPWFVRLGRRESSFHFFADGAW